MSVHEPRPATSKDLGVFRRRRLCLHERVLSLRLPQGASSRGTGSAKAAWALVAVLAVVVGVLAYCCCSGDRPDAGRRFPGKTGRRNADGILRQYRLGFQGLHHARAADPRQPEGQRHDRQARYPRRPPVKKGAVLAELEDTDYKADMDHAESALKAARQRLAEIEAMRPREIGQAKAELERAKPDLVQLKADFERSQRSVPEAEGHFAVGLRTGREQVSPAEQRVRSLGVRLGTAGDSRGNKVAAAKADVQQAEADLDKARWRLDNCKIRAPINGTILKKNAEEGNLVNPIAMNGSFSLCDLADLSDLEVELTIEERNISKVFGPEVQGPHRGLSRSRV